jgi:hypothetical protein
MNGQTWSAKVNKCLYSKTEVVRTNNKSNPAENRYGKSAGADALSCRPPSLHAPYSSTFISIAGFYIWRWLNDRMLSRSALVQQGAHVRLDRRTPTWSTRTLTHWGFVWQCRVRRGLGLPDLVRKRICLQRDWNSAHLNPLQPTWESSIVTAHRGVHLRGSRDPRLWACPAKTTLRPPLPRAASASPATRSRCTSPPPLAPLPHLLLRCIPFPFLFSSPPLFLLGFRHSADGDGDSGGAGSDYYSHGAFPSPLVADKSIFPCSARSTRRQDRFLTKFLFV